MEINRNQYFMIGVVILLVGLQFRAVGQYVLNEKATQFLAKRASEPTAAIESSDLFFAPDTTTPVVPAGVQKTIKMPLAGAANGPKPSLRALGMGQNPFWDTEFGSVVVPRPPHHMALRRSAAKRKIA